MQHWKTSETVMGGWLPFIAKEKNEERREVEAMQFEPPSDREPLIKARPPLH